jgi:hypothetical protein
MKRGCIALLIGIGVILALPLVFRQNIIDAGLQYERADWEACVREETDSQANDLLSGKLKPDANIAQDLRDRLEMNSDWSSKGKVISATYDTESKQIVVKTMILGKGYEFIQSVSHETLR